MGKKTFKGGFTQLIQEVGTDPEVTDLFPQPDPAATVPFPRILREPSIYCPKGHPLKLGRLPWQSSCHHCPDHLGWTQKDLQMYYLHMLQMNPLPWGELVKHPFQEAQFMDLLREDYYKAEGGGKSQQGKGQGSGSSEQPLKPQPPSSVLTSQESQTDFEDVFMQPGYYLNALEKLDPQGEAQKLLSKLKESQHMEELRDSKQLGSAVKNVQQQIKRIAMAQDIQQECIVRLKCDLETMQAQQAQNELLITELSSQADVLFAAAEGEEEVWEAEERQMEALLEVMQKMNLSPEALQELLSRRGKASQSSKESDQAKPSQQTLQQEVTQQTVEKELSEQCLQPKPSQQTVQEEVPQQTVELEACQKNAFQQFLFEEDTAQPAYSQQTVQPESPEPEEY